MNDLVSASMSRLRYRSNHLGSGLREVCNWDLGSAAVLL